MNHELSKLVNNRQGSNEPLPEPHFDDEATLLSARRVVPFHKLTDKTKSKRYLVFAGTLAAALIMGVVGGVIYARLEGTPASTVKTTESVAQPALQDEFASSSVQGEESVSAPEESKALATDNGNQKTVDKPRNPSIGARKGVSLNASAARRVQSEPDEWKYYANERERRRAERREARRARRQAAREAQQSDDLFRIREIFEGSSRP